MSRNSRTLKKASVSASVSSTVSPGLERSRLRAVGSSRSTATRRFDVRLRLFPVSRSHSRILFIAVWRSFDISRTGRRRGSALRISWDSCACRSITRFE